jgi:hypothetical protein
MVATKISVAQFEPNPLRQRLRRTNLPAHFVDRSLNAWLTGGYRSRGRPGAGVVFIRSRPLFRLSLPPGRH